MCNLFSVRFRMDTTEPHSSLHLLMTNPSALFTHFCEDHQKKHTRVALSTLQKNNTMQSNFLHYYYETAIQPHIQTSEAETDDDFMAILAFYTDHMANVYNSKPFNINNGKGQTTNVREARTASFQYCMELIPQIQKKMLVVHTDNN